MQPGLHEGQRLLVNKVAYSFHEPERGDIIVFQPPNNRQSDYIKRIIASPGDTIEIKNGSVYVNDVKLDEPYISEKAKSNFKEDEVPEGDYFVLGDNRNSSNDSRRGWTVPRENIIGKAWLSIWPPREWGLAPNYSLEEQMAGSTNE